MVHNNFIIKISCYSNQDRFLIIPIYAYVQRKNQLNTIWNQKRKQ
jgi:hypothetical protein